MFIQQHPQQKLLIQKPRQTQ